MRAEARVVQNMSRSATATASMCSQCGPETLATQEANTPCRSLLVYVLLVRAFLLAQAATAQEQTQDQSSGAQGGISASQIAKANNPLADLNAVNFHNYFSPSLYGVSGESANTMNLRPVVVAGQHIVRATLPIQTTPVGQGQYRSGLGDLNIFDAIKLTPEGAATDFAVGPLLVAPSATNSALGAGKWQAGVATVAIHPMPGGSLVGMLATWQHSFAGDVDRPSAHVATFQPIGTFSIGGGYYFRSTAVCLFDFQNDKYLVPFGLGVGKVLRIGSAVANAFIEPQFSAYHKGAGLPAFQLFVGLNLQWLKK